MFKTQTNVVRRMLMLSAFACTSVALMGAQAVVQTPAVDATHSSLFSSSAESDAPATVDVASVHAVGPNFAEMMQYGGRQRYGRPRYRGGNTNADGSAKYTFFAGAGFTQPIGNTFNYFTPNYGLQVGAGRNFNRHVGLMLQFDYDHFGLTGGTLSNQSYLYTGDTHPSDNGIDAGMHVWSFSLNPVYNLHQGESVGLYTVVGVGFYHKVTNFTAPQSEYYCTYYGCGVVAVQSNFDNYTSNAPGFNGGFGLTYKFSRFSNERFFGEVRYVFMDNSQRTGITAKNVNTAYGRSYTGYDYFPANSNRTTYIPVKFGIRF